MARYAAISEDISVSEDWADLVATDPKAAIVYSMCWPHADFYGILPGSPRKFSATVCPLLGLTPAKVEKIITLLVERGFAVRYEANSEAYLWLPKWGTRNDVRWDKVRVAPARPFPEFWQPPESLVKFLAKADDSCLLLEWFDRSGKFLSVPVGSGNVQASRARAGVRCVLAVDGDVSDSDGEGNGEVEEPALDISQLSHLLASDAGTWQVVVHEVSPLMPSNAQGRPSLKSWGIALAEVCVPGSNYPLDRTALEQALRDDPPDITKWPDKWLAYHGDKRRAEKGRKARLQEAEAEKTTPAQRRQAEVDEENQRRRVALGR